MTLQVQNNHVVSNNKTVPSGKELMDIVDTTKLLATCPYYQKLGAGGVLAIWLTAREMNLPPMMCLNGGMYTFSGLVSLSAQLMNMMIVNAGHRADVIQLDQSKCHIRFWRRDRSKENSTFDYVFSIEDARNANLLGKTNWKTNPKDMLYNRCLSGGARKFMPDVIMGAYAIGELPEDAEVLDVIPEDIKQNIPLSPPQMDNIIYITQEQADELNKWRSECDPTTQTNMTEYLKNTLKVEEMTRLPLSRYQAFKDLVLLRRADYQKKLKEMENDANRDESVENGVLEGDERDY